MERCEGPGVGKKQKDDSKVNDKVSREHLKEQFLMPRRGEGAIPMNSYSGHEYSKEGK